jgi:putative flippase GtrA/4-amino-4-deoxy-L-arabinose transferase-like glycosyltransferase
VELAQRLMRLANDQRVRFLAVGGVNTVVGYAIFALVSQWVLRDVPFGYLAALVISYAIALVLAFFLYRSFVFKVTGSSVRDFVRFTSVYAVSIAINLAVLPLLVEMAHVSPLIAQAVILVITTLISYVGHRFFSFRRPEEVLAGEGDKPTDAGTAVNDGSGTVSGPSLGAAASTIAAPRRTIAPRVTGARDWRRFMRVHIGSWHVLAGLLIVGFALRLFGVAWGLPQMLHPDEHVVVEGALDLAARNSFEPSMYFRPDHVEIQLSYIAYALFSKIFLNSSVLVGYAAQPETYLLISRLVTVGFALAVIVLAWFVGRSINARVGFFSALIATLLPLFVEHAHYATPDVPLTAAFLGVVLALSYYIRAPRIPSLLFASACVSIAVAMKYPGAIATLMIAVVVVFAAVRDRNLTRIFSHGALAMIAVVGFLFVISPVLFTNYQAVVQSFTNESDGHGGADGLSKFGNFLFYGELMGAIFGIFLVAMILLGVLDAVQRRRSITIPWVIGIITWVILSALLVHWDRWSLPMFITPLLFAALGLNRAWELTQQWRVRRPVKVAVVSAASGVMLANLVLPSIAIGASLAAPDTRLASQASFAELGITRENAIYEGYTPLDPSLVNFIFPDFSSTADGKLVPLDATKEWVVLSSCSYDRFEDPVRYDLERQFYADVADSFELEFNVNARESFTERRSILEPVNIARAVSDIVAYARGAQAGCDLSAYRIPAQPAPDAQDAKPALPVQ